MDTNWKRSLLVLGATVIAACGGGDGGTTGPGGGSPPTVATVTVTLPNAQLVQGATVMVSVEVRSSSGAPLNGRSLSWNSSTPSVATVDATGLIRGVAPGNTTISATSEGRTGSVVLTVVPPPVATVTILIASPSIATGISTTATAELREAGGAIVSGRAISWTSTSANVATVDVNGTVVGVSPGTTNISATSEGKTGSAVVTVILPPVATVDVQLTQATVNVGTTTNATAIIRDNAGNLLNNRTVTWNSSAPSVAAVNAAGVISTIAVGTAVITATVEGKVGSSTLKVQPPPVASVVVSGDTGALATGDRRQLIATARDANNTVLTDRLVVWASSNQAIASVSVSGEVTAISQGTATITATSEGRSGTYVTAVISAVASASITGSTRIKVGDTYHYSVTARRADGTVIVRPLLWSVKQPAMGTIASSGALTPLQPGTLTLQVEIDGALWQADYTVYDWDTFESSGSTFASLAADNLIVNKFGRSEYARLVFVCSSAGYFFSWVSTQNFVTQNGLVGLSFDGGTPFTQTWDESDDFDTLFRPGNNLSVKSFAAQVASARTFGFAFTEFQAGAKAMIFRVTALSARLQPMLAQCPSNSLLVAPEATDVEAFAQNKQRAVAQFNAIMSGASDAESELKGLRLRRGAVGSTKSVAPMLGVAPTSITVTEQSMRRK